jgi:predicted  nucleic acid-binding Zn-ribbon protein
MPEYAASASIRVSLFSVSSLNCQLTDPVEAEIIRKNYQYSLSLQNLLQEKSSVIQKNRMSQP